MPPVRDPALIAQLEGAQAIPRVIEGPPREPAPQTLSQAEKDRLEAEIAARTPGRQDFQDQGHLRTEFEKLAPVQTYRTVVPQYISAIQAGDSQAGDLQLIYAFGKIMDPGSVVREGELEMAQSTGSVGERLKGYFASVSGGARLTPEIRRQLLGEIRTRASTMSDAYNQAREQYKSLAERYGFDPEAIVGPHPGAPHQQAEADWKASLGAGPVVNRDGSMTFGRGADSRIEVGDIGFSGLKEDAPLVGATPPQAVAEMNAALARGATAEQLEAIARKYGLPGGEYIQRAIAVRDKDPRVRFIGGEGRPEAPPDISGQRGSGGIVETLDAGVRGAADVLTLGFADEIAAAGNTVFGDGTMRENLARERAVDRFDAERHFPSRLAGQIAGGFALPIGAVSTPGQLARTGALYGGGYGFGSGEGDLLDRGTNALLGAGAGGIVGAGLGVAGQAGKRAVSALGSRIVGPSTPRQNALLAAGTEEGVPLNMSDLYPGTLNTVATLETIPGASSVIREGIGAGRDAIEGRVQNLARGGTAREDMGQVAQDAGHRFVARSRAQADRLYKRAERVANDTLITPQSVVQTLSGLVRREADTPGGTRAGAVIQQYADAFSGGGAITIGGARRMRSELLSRLRDDGGLSKREATRVTGQIMGAINEDIERSLTQAGRGAAVQAYRSADRFYAQSRDEIDNITERFIGTDDRPKSAEQTLALLQTAAGPKGNSEGLRGMLTRLSPEERRDFAATIVEPLGRLSAEEPFSPGTFIQNIRKVSPAARRLIFGAGGERSIQNLVMLSNAKKQTVARLNNSRSGQVGNYRTVLSSVVFGVPGGGAVMGAAAGLNFSTGALGGAAIAATGIGASRAIARALMNEDFTRLLAQAPATTNPKAINAHIGRLRALGAKDPNVRSAVEAIEESLLRAVNDNVPTRAAASGGSDAEGE